ncbi:MAG: hypothetical protein ABMA25_18735 [Ilumatobacteraceae bacterium]
MLFRQLELDTTRLYETGDYRSALQRLDAESGNFPELGHRCKIAFLRACLLARAGAPDAALDVLDAATEEGLWWAESMLADHDLDSCRGERLDRITRHAELSPDAPSCFVHEGLPGAGVLLALHGGSECVSGRDNPWAAAADAGWTVYRPVSSQRRGAGLATWTDLDVAVEECRTHLARIGTVDAIGAFSLGASLALRLITEVVNVPALMVAPSLRPLVVERAVPKVTGAVIDIIIGEHDPFLNLASRGVDQLRAAGARLRIEIVPDVAHHFPPDFEQHLTDRLDNHLRRPS